MMGFEHPQEIQMAPSSVSSPVVELELGIGGIDLQKAAPY
jgi:hypothetical protein